MWFEILTGFEEKSGSNVRENLMIDGNSFVSKPNGRRFAFGKLEVPTLEELRSMTTSSTVEPGRIRVKEIIANVQELHLNEENSNALFQAASQFNLLEMIGPHITPEAGVDRYEQDYTQGPACAIACGAGTIYRNYFVPVNGQTGQTKSKQIDCLDLIGKELDNEHYHLWEMQNGYALANEAGLLNINKQIANLDNSSRENLKGKLKVGVQWNTEVTISESGQRVSQIYCSALPVAYSQVDEIYWESFARLILEATYEATLHVALLNLQNYKSNKVYLTLVGGGAFGNRQDWILESLFKAINLFKDYPLDISVVSYSRSNAELKDAIIEFSNSS